MQNKANKTSDKLLFSAISFTLLLVLVIPLTYIASELQIKIANHEMAILSTTKRDLVNEMSEFQSDLSPTLYVEKAMKSIIASQISNPSQFKPKQFSIKCKKILNSKYGIKTDILVCANKNFSKIFSYYSDKNIKEGDTLTERDYLFAIAPFFNNNIFLQNIAKDMRKQKNYFGASILKKRNSNISHFGLKRNYLKLGNFSQGFPLSETCRSYYSNELDHQLLFLYSQSIIYDKKFYGTILMGVTQANLSPKRMLERAIYKHLGSKTTRKCNKNTSTQRSARNSLSIHSYIHPSFTNLVFTYKKKNKNINLEINTDSKISISINKSDLKSDLKWLHSATIFINKCIILFVFFFWIKGVMFGIRFPLGLRRKFLLIVAFIAILPSLFIALFSFFIYHQIEAFHLSKGKSLISNKINQFERLLDEKESRLILHGLCLKKQYQNLLKNYNANSFDHIPRIKTWSNDIQRRHLFDKYGNTKMLYQRTTPNPLSIIHGVTILSNLGTLQENSPNTKRWIKMKNLTTGVTGDLFNIINDQSIFASESEVTQSPIQIDGINKALFQLITDSKAYQNICAVIFVNLADRDFLDRLVTALLEKQPNLFVIKDDELCGSIHIARNFLNSFNPEPILRQQTNQKLVNLCKMAVQTKVSGNRIKISSNTKDLFEWQYRNDSRYVIAAHLELNKEKKMHAFFLFLPAFAGAMAMIILIILAEIMADLFTSQISMLHKAAENIIIQNNFLAKVSIHTGDELEDMGNSFNKMTTSLQERKNISRFVSEKLISVLGKQSDNTETLGEKTIVAILSTDIRDFTTITETYPPEIVVNLLNEYFTIMEEAIIHNGGVIDKFIGDAIIAIFYSNQKQSHTLDACKAAMAMREALSKFNNTRKSNNLFTLENGIGIAAGEVISGNVGSPDTYMEYTVIGQPIDTANMLEAASKIGKHTKIMLDEFSTNAVTSNFIFHKIERKFHSPIYEIKHTNDEK